MPLLAQPIFCKCKTSIVRGRGKKLVGVPLVVLEPLQAFLFSLHSALVVPGGVLVQGLVGGRVHVAEGTGVAGRLYVALLHVVHDVLLHAGGMAAGPTLPHLPRLKQHLPFSYELLDQVFCIFF